MNDADLLAAFLAPSLPEKEWTHRAHIRVGWILLETTSAPTPRARLDRAFTRMRDGLHILNASHNVRDEPTRGYHETITLAFMRVLDAARREIHTPDSDSFCDARPDLMTKLVLLKHYSRERIMSAEAKARFIEPDLEPLPPLPSDTPDTLQT
ncbi:MAG: hypothetical protein AB7G17_06520 [Phycisphaerales bacterium]